MAWEKDWTPEIVKANYKALGMVDHEDIEQLLEDSIELQRMYRVLGRRGMAELGEMVDMREDQLEQDN